jgi:hypothetical protein
MEEKREILESQFSRYDPMKLLETALKKGLGSLYPRVMWQKKL